MICDKCGCEHNSRSVCPKCGERVIFVNSDYERRKREWEEAQKKGSTPPAEPKKAPSEKKNNKKKGFSEMLSLSFAAFKGWLIKILARIIVKWNQLKKRGLHKRVIGIAAGVMVLAIAIPVLIHNLRRIDKTRVFCFDGKYGYYVGSEDEPVIGTQGGSKIAYSGENGFIAVDPKGFDIWVDGKTTRVDAVKPQLIGWNDSLTAVLYLTDEGYVLYNGNSNPVKYSHKAENIRDCKISDNGQYFALVAVSEDAEDYTCYFDYGTPEGIKEAERDSEQKTILEVTDEGQVLYVEMSTAEYGIVNERKACLYDGSLMKTLADIKDYRYVDDKLYYIDKADDMYRYDLENVENLDEEVVGFYDNASGTSHVFYTKDDGFYLAGGSKDSTLPMFSADLSGMTIYYRNNYLYLTDNTSLYVVRDFYDGSEPEKICDLKYDTGLIWHQNEKCFFTVSAEGELLKLTSAVTQVMSDVESVMTVENYEGYSYVSGGLRYFVPETGKKAKVCDSTEMPAEGQKIIYSKKYFYYHDIYNNLWKIDKKCNKIQRLSNVELCIFVE